MYGYYGLRSLRYFPPDIWNIIPINVNNLSDLALKIKSWILYLMIELVIYAGLIYVR